MKKIMVSGLLIVFFKDEMRMIAILIGLAVLYWELLTYWNINKLKVLRA